MTLKRKSKALDSRGTRRATKKVLRDLRPSSKSAKSNLTTGEVQLKFHSAVRRSTPSEGHLTFPIVGIGSSAGGIEACSEFFKRVPPNSGMAFVVIQHLAADQESVLSEILSRCTEMPVKQADHLVSVQPNHVYVIPPNRSLGIVHGGLRLMPRIEPRSRHMPIDFFFRCLADDQKSNSIGIIFSGGDGDGALGLQAIKAEGGITFAQDPATARVSSMPEAAVSTGNVDYVLPIDEIAREIARLGEHPFMSVGPSKEEILPDDEAGLATLFRLLRNKHGVDFSLYKKATLQRRLKRRMLLHKISSLSEYQKCLQDHPSELERLFEDLLINVTSFFRDGDLFEVLKDTVLPRILKKRNADTPVRIWVPGCATGEEAYSLAICVQEAFSDLGVTFPVQVFATDLSEAAVQKARSGFYPESIRTDVSPERLRRFFTKIDGGYQVLRGIRDLCVFAKHDVTRAPPFSRVDIISCRNLLIYLGPVLQKSVIHTFAYALNPGGHLILGPSETAGTSASLFTVADKKNKIYVRKSTVARASLNLSPVSVPLLPVRTGQKAAPKRKGFNVPSDLQTEINRIIIAKYNPVCVVVNEDNQVFQYIGKTSQYLEHQTGEATLDLFKMARNGLQVALRSALKKAKTSPSAVMERGVTFQSNDAKVAVNLEIRRFYAGTAGRFYLVFFDDVSPSGGRQKSNKHGKKDLRRQKRDGDATLVRLQDELAATTEYLKSSLRELEVANEELQSANEEILSSNEELQSSNEELETAKEELQSSNEELSTVNEELSNRNAQLSYLYDDLRNLLASVNIPIVMVGNDLRIRRYTPQAEKLMNLISTDVGRPITDIKPNFELPRLKEIVLEAIETMSTAQHSVVDKDGRRYSLRVRPYRTVENKIDGVVLIFVDIDSVIKPST